MLVAFLRICSFSLVLATWNLVQHSHSRGHVPFFCPLLCQTFFQPFSLEVKDEMRNQGACVEVHLWALIEACDCARFKDFVEIGMERSFDPFFFKKKEIPRVWSLPYRGHRFARPSLSSCPSPGRQEWSIRREALPTTTLKQGISEIIGDNKIPEYINVVSCCS